MSDRQDVRVLLSSTERRGAWSVPRDLAVNVTLGNAELDLREATLEPGLTTFHVRVTLGNVEVIVPPNLRVEMQVGTVLANAESSDAQASMSPDDRRTLRIVGTAKLANCEVVTLAEGESRSLVERRERHHRRQQRWREWHAEKEMWRREHPSNWMPWWLMARMRRRMFSWLALAFAAGIAIGYYQWETARWYHVVLFGFLLSAMSGAIAWRLTRPLIMAVRAAREIGDGKLETRIDSRRHGGEMRLLATAINDMASRIEKQLKDQRELLAAVSHELRTPLGHMRVLIETARERRGTDDGKALAELDREVLVLDDLVGKLLASSRLEFGNLDRRELDLGELVGDIATSAGIPPEAIEAIGDVRAAIDPTLVRRAIANLIDNARVHGGGAIAVRVERRAGQVAVEVDDAGPGVTPDRRADAFRAFVPSSGGGLGLGLALVSRIAVAHGGGAWITERPGGGARVGFTVSVRA